MHNREGDCECKGDNSPILGAVGALLRAPGRAVPEAQSNRGVRGTTRGSQPATPCAQLSRRRAEVRGAQPTAVAIAAVCRGARSTTYGSGAREGGRGSGFEKRLRTTTTNQTHRNNKFGCTSLLATTCNHMEIIIMKNWVRAPPGNLLWKASDRTGTRKQKCQPPNRYNQIRNTSVGTKRN